MHAYMHACMHPNHPCLFLSSYLQAASTAVPSQAPPTGNRQVSIPTSPPHANTHTHTQCSRGPTQPVSRIARHTQLHNCEHALHSARTSHSVQAAKQPAYMPVWTLSCERGPTARQWLPQWEGLPVGKSRCPSQPAPSSHAPSPPGREGSPLHVRPPPSHVKPGGLNSGTRRFTPSPVKGVARLVNRCSET
jgi:hypothetical protein